MDNHGKEEHNKTHGEHLETLFVRVPPSGLLTTRDESGYLKMFLYLNFR
jgi:hypothetical protein